MLDKDLGAPKVAKLEDASIGIEEEVLRLDITMTNSLRMNIGKRAKKLIDVELDFEERHGGLHLVEVARGTIHGLGDILEHEIEVDFVLLGVVSTQMFNKGRLQQNGTRSPLE